MKLNWAERMVVNNPMRAFWQGIEIRWLRKKMSLQGGSMVLEVGCGRGAGARLILKEFQPALLHALDLDIQMVEMAKRYLSAPERERVSLYVGDVCHLPFKDASMDAIFAFGVLHHAPDWRGALAEIARILRVNGVYIMEEIYPALYLNFMVKHLLLHPTEDRFRSHDLWGALTDLRLAIKEAIEFKSAGILGVAIKETNDND